MTRAELYERITATRRSQRVALLIALSPFYLALALGWLTETPIALFVGAIGLVVVAGIYWRYAPENPPLPRRQTTIHAAGEDE